MVIKASLLHTAASKAPRTKTFVAMQHDYMLASVKRHACQWEATTLDKWCASDLFVTQVMQLPKRWFDSEPSLEPESSHISKYLLPIYLVNIVVSMGMSLTFTASLHSVTLPKSSARPKGTITIIDPPGLILMYFTPYCCWSSSKNRRNSHP